MASLINLEVTRTYKTKANVVKAVEAKYSGSDLRYLIMTHDDGRFYPVFIGEKAINEGVHFNFHVVG